MDLIISYTTQKFTFASDLPKGRVENSELERICWSGSFDGRPEAVHSMSMGGFPNPITLQVPKFKQQNNSTASMSAQGHLPHTTATKSTNATRQSVPTHTQHSPPNSRCMGATLQAVQDLAEKICPVPESLSRPENSARRMVHSTQRQQANG